MTENGFSGIFLKISGVVYLILMGDVLLAISTAPVWLLLFLTSLRQSWLALAIVAPLLAPAIGAAYVTFDAFVHDGSTAVVRTFVRGWARLARRALPIGVAASALGVVVGVDMYAVAGTSWGVVTVPAFLAAAILGLVAFVTGLAVIARRPDVGRLQALKLGLVFGVRGGLWSLVSLAVIGVFGWMLLQHPALALIAAPAPVLFIVWFNANRALEGWLGQDGNSQSAARQQEGICVR